MAACELLVVPGHLWIVASPRADLVRLDRDLTVVVEGNLYVGASLEIEGPGRLLFVTIAGDLARPFADRDGNGRWSEGDVTRQGEFLGVLEGGGNVYLGLPNSAAAISLDAGLIAGGEVHVAAPTAALLVPARVVATAVAAALAVAALAVAAAAARLVARLEPPHQVVESAFVTPVHRDAGELVDDQKLAVVHQHAGLGPGGKQTR